MKLLLCLTLLIFTSCSKSKEVVLQDVRMGIPYKVIVRDASTKKESKEIQGIVDETFKLIDEKLNGWNKHSEIALWNQSKSTLPIKVSPTLLTIIKLCDQAHTLTDGAFDPSLGKLIHAWKMSLRIGKPLSKREIDQIAPSLGWDKVIIGDGTLQKSHPEIEIDLDGISKGYFCDLCIENLKQAGYLQALVEWGGEVKTAGGPFKVLSGTEIIHLTNSSIATSGPKYQIYPISQGSNTLIYSHFIDRKTMTPVQFNTNGDSQSVILESCALADALATAKFTKNHKHL
ncbi:MAG: FAD:protein FMN transferase [Chlamydiia bacterium]|nr:FAD:protein FMN transferase [Chlamydiia bacterium]MCH9624468.1 FAD:protein FMN transferase [Chlamydiia bacterium]